MPEINVRQAYVIEGAEPLANPNGSAPGLFVEDAGRTLVVLPGPPRELQPMFETDVRPRLERLGDGMIVRRRVLMVADWANLVVDEKIAPIYQKYENADGLALYKDRGAGSFLCVPRMRICGRGAERTRGKKRCRARRCGVLDGRRGDGRGRRPDAGAYGEAGFACRTAG